MIGQLRAPYEYAAWARSLSDGTPVAETAKGVCIIRGVNPYDFHPSGMNNWQAIAMEALLLVAIAREEPQ